MALLKPEPICSSWFWFTPPTITGCALFDSCSAWNSCVKLPPQFSLKPS